MDMSMKNTKNGGKIMNRLPLELERKLRQLKHPVERNYFRKSLKKYIRDINSAERRLVKNPESIFGKDNLDLAKNNLISCEKELDREIDEPYNKKWRKTNES